MGLIGWYAKRRIKYLVVFILISIVFWYFFVREWKPYDTDPCFKDKCKIETAYGKDSRGGNCTGSKCFAGNCVGENCRAGDCFGKLCKAGDCYGLNCTPGTCKDTNCKSKKDNNKASPTYGQEIGCVQGKCADGRAYDIDRGKNRKYLKHFPENTYSNKQYCDTVLAQSELKNSGTKNKDTKIWKSDMKIRKILFYHKGLKNVTFKKDSRKDPDPIIVQRDPIMETIPLIYKGDNCQWCTKYQGYENCSNYKPKHKTEEVGPKNKKEKKDKWTWEPGDIYKCYPRDNKGIVINCDQRSLDDGRITFQHDMVQIDQNTFRCKYCNRTCTKKI